MHIPFRNYKHIFPGANNIETKQTSSSQLIKVKNVKNENKISQQIIGQ